MAFTKNADGVMIPNELLGASSTGTDYTSWDRPAGTIDWNLYTGLDDLKTKGIVGRYKLPSLDALESQVKQEYLDEFDKNKNSPLFGLMGGSPRVTPSFMTNAFSSVGGGGGGGTISIQGSIDAINEAKSRLAALKDTSYKKGKRGTINAVPMWASDYGLKDTNAQSILEDLGYTTWDLSRDEKARAQWEKMSDKRQAQIDKMDEDTYATYLQNQKNRSLSAILANPHMNDYVAEVAARHNTTPEQVYQWVNQYQEGLNTIADPVGANWQNLKNAPFYGALSEQMRKVSPISKTFVEKLKDQVPDANLDPYYYIWNTADKPGYQELGNKGNLIGYNTMQNVGWADFLPADVVWQQATPEQKAQAEADYKSYIRMVSASPKKGGAFDLREAVGHTPGKYWYAVDSPELNKFDISQEFLNRESGGKKSYKDVGLDPNKAWKSGWEYDAPSGGFLGGMGGLLGGALSLASMIVPGPASIALSLAGKGLGMASAIDSGNPLSAAASILGSVGSIGGIDAAGKLTSAGSLFDKATTGLTNITGSPAISQGLINAGMGGLTGGMKGAVIGGASPIINSQVAGLTSNPTVNSLIGQGIKTGLGYALSGNHGAGQVATQTPSSQPATSGQTKMVNGVPFKFVNGIWVHA